LRRFLVDLLQRALQVFGAGLGDGRDHGPQGDHHRLVLAARQQAATGLIVAGRPGIGRHPCCLLAQVRRPGPLASALRSEPGRCIGFAGPALARGGCQPRVVSFTLDQDMQRVRVLPRLGAGNHPGLVGGPGVELGGTRVVLVMQAVARVCPCLEGVFFSLCPHDKFRG
jgi:hypothetical protein